MQNKYSDGRYAIHNAPQLRRRNRAQEDYVIIPSTHTKVLRIDVKELAFTSTGRTTQFQNLPFFHGIPSPGRLFLEENPLVATF